MKILYSEQTKRVEAIAESAGFNSKRMMENAGTAASKVICEKQDVKDKNVVILAGRGNNGGDSFVVARKLHNAGARVSVVLVAGTPQTESAREMLAKLSPLPIRNFEVNDPDVDYVIANADIIVDAIFGIGFSGTPDLVTEKIISKANSAKGVRIALDLPSGCECDTGKVNSVCIKADFTVTFITVKPCHVLCPSSEYCGKLIRVSIGLPAGVLDGVDSNVTIIEDGIVKENLPKRRKNSHKGSVGELVMLCGSYGMSGAAYLSGLSAIRSGVGIARMILPDSIYPILASSLPEVVYTPYASDNMSDAVKEISHDFEKAKAAVIGCGLGTSKEAVSLVNTIVSSSQIPVVLDADGINIISDNIDILLKSEVPVILTPHPAEMARLMGITTEEVQNSRFRVATVFARNSKKIVVLKGSNTIVALPDGRLFVCMRGNSGMATAGSGDVLAGIIGSLVAQGLSPELAAVCGVHIHAFAGDLAASHYSLHGMIARDIIEFLPSLFKQYED